MGTKEWWEAEQTYTKELGKRPLSESLSEYYRLYDDEWHWKYEDNWLPQEEEAVPGIRRLYKTMGFIYRDCLRDERKMPTGPKHEDAGQKGKKQKSRKSGKQARALGRLLKQRKEQNSERE